MNSAELAHARILIVDDEDANISVLVRILTKSGYGTIQSTTSPRSVPALCASWRPDLILLDLQMPDLDGIGVLEQLRPLIPPDSYLPILILTGDHSPQAKRKALSTGATDFLTKPFDMTEVLLRIRNLLDTRSLHLRLQDQNQLLEIRVLERTAALEKAQQDILERLAGAGEFRDDETGQHTSRVGTMSADLAGAMGADSRMVDLIRRAAPLHDLGKIGIPDRVLLKPGAFTPEDAVIMRTHTTIGAQILFDGESDLIRLAERIARSRSREPSSIRRWRPRFYRPSYVKGPARETDTPQLWRPLDCGGNDVMSRTSGPARGLSPKPARPTQPIKGERVRIVVLLLSAVLPMLACAPKNVAPESPSPAASQRPIQAPAPAPVSPEVTRRITRLELALLEKEAQVEELQFRLNDTRQEVVRAMSKLQTLATRAEAASGMAEAEVALQALRTGAGSAVTPEAAQATRLLQEGSTEFSKLNYGGALYLANQAKTLAGAGRGRLAAGDRGVPRPGETAFALPIRLKAVGRGNVREGPGAKSRLAFAVEGGAPLTGYSYIDEWIRISDDDGRGGWISRGLVARR